MQSLVVATRFLQAVIVLLGVGVLTFMLWEPHLEGRNAHATLIEIYFKDPFLAYVYLGSIPFFVALYHAFKVLEYISQGKALSQATLSALRMIKYCAFITASAIVAADIYLVIAARSSGEDPAGAVMLGIVAAFAAVVMGTAALMFERILQNCSKVSPCTISPTTRNET